MEKTWDSIPLMIWCNDDNEICYWTSKTAEDVCILLVTRTVFKIILNSVLAVHFPLLLPHLNSSFPLPVSFAWVGFCFSFLQQTFNNTIYTFFLTPLSCSKPYQMNWIVKSYYTGSWKYWVHNAYSVVNYLPVSSLITFWVVMTLRGLIAA